MVGASSLLAQPGSVQKVAKSVFSLTTFNKDGGIIASTQGVFIDNKGTAISTFKPFIGATKATVVDAKGRKKPRRITSLPGVTFQKPAARLFISKNLIFPQRASR